MLVSECVQELCIDLMSIVDVVEVERFNVTELLQSVSIVWGVVVVFDSLAVEVIVKVVTDVIEVSVMIEGE
jgi:hypothetical protein